MAKKSIAASRRFGLVDRILTREAWSEDEWAKDKPPFYRQLRFDIWSSLSQQRAGRKSGDLNKLNADMASINWAPHEKREWPLGTVEGMWHYVGKLWGMDIRSSYQGGTGLAVAYLRELLAWKKRGARRFTAMERALLTAVGNRKYGSEIVFQAVLEEAADYDPGLARVLTPNTAYLLFACGAAKPPKDEDERRAAEQRWRHADRRSAVARVRDALFTIPLFGDKAGEKVPRLKAVSRMRESARRSRLR